MVESLIDAAAELFAQRGPANVTVREIAARAQVNHALVHRHFETKERLVQAVLERFALRFRSTIQDAGSARNASRLLGGQLHEQAAFIRLIAHLVLEDASSEQLVVPGGGLGAMAELLAEKRTPEVARLYVLTSAALALGWAFFRPFLLAALGPNIDAEQAEGAIQDAQRRIARGRV